MSEKRPMRSDSIKSGFERAPHRSLVRATGAIQSESDFQKPFIGICNSYINLIPNSFETKEKEGVESGLAL